MKILILGGTVFLGRHLVDAARSRSHQVTLFHRGRSHPELFPDMERLIGDRTRDLTALRGRSWDAVIDTCGFTPATVGRSAAALAEVVGHYTFVSSISVYAAYPLAGIDEEAPLKSMTTEQLLEAEKNIWISDRFLEAQGVGPWVELPLWLPATHNGFFAVRNDRAIAAGLTFRPLAQTIGDTLAWDSKTAAKAKWKTGLDPAVEQKLLSLHAAAHTRET